ncbi:MAG: 5-formyltetrahydrofolate cyclo-ligase [Chthoniobacteraceae bacterium]|nr:5-formyltetrahydrofolate cyclo-ligase [Chthoniobacteraceae bacterium]
MTKPELRKALRVRLAALPFEAKAEKSAAICRAASQTPQWREARTVAFFAPLPEEPNIDLLWAVLGKRIVCYPRVNGDNLVFLRVPNREALLESGRWNLLEPPHHDDHVVPAGAIDLFFIPGIAFTADGRRMGRGKGYYDRLLAQPDFRAPAFGVCFAEQLVPHLPTEDHDRPVNRVFSA